MWRKKYLWIGCVFLYLSSGSVQSNSSNDAITKKSLLAHVAYLSSASLEGRLTGSRGEKLATQYAANIFEQLGLVPAGDNGTFFQEFNFTSGVSLGKNNAFSITYSNGKKKNLILNQDWRPISFSENTTFENTELVFVGYGITAPAMANLPAYDSYHELNVKNKWVVAFRYTPEKIGSDARRQLSQYSSLRYKAFTAKEKGAKGIIFVSGPNSKVKNELIPLSFDTSLSNSSIVAISVKDNVVNEWLSNSPHSFNSLQKLQDKIDGGLLNIRPELTGIQIAGQIDIQQKKQHARNVLAKLKVATGITAAVMMGAHIDHLGHGELSGSRSRENEMNLIHYGADDNASGVASVLEAAITLSHLKAQNKLHGNKDILIALWSGEELGLLGSTYFIKSLMEKTGKRSIRPLIDVYINLDMVGRLRENLILQGVGSSTSWAKIIKRAHQKQSITIIMQNDPYLPTDSTSFYLHGVPTLNLFTGSHDEYHTPRDTIDLINFAGMQSISKFLVNLMITLETNSHSMDYQQVKKPSNYTKRGFRVYLGTIPDYASTNIVGVKLSGVTKDSPAEHAGLKQDDVLVELDGKKIRDIYEYTFVLSALHAKHPVSLIVLREQKKVALTIVPQSRE